MPDIENPMQNNLEYHVSKTLLRMFGPYESVILICSCGWIGSLTRLAGDDGFCPNCGFADDFIEKDYSDNEAFQAWQYFEDRGWR